MNALYAVTLGVSPTTKHCLQGNWLGSLYMCLFAHSVDDASRKASVIASVLPYEMRSVRAERYEPDPEFGDDIGDEIALTAKAARHHSLAAYLFTDVKKSGARMLESQTLYKVALAVQPTFNHPLAGTFGSGVLTMWLFAESEEEAQGKCRTVVAVLPYEIETWLGVLPAPAQSLIPEFQKAADGARMSGLAVLLKAEKETLSSN